MTKTFKQKSIALLVAVFLLVGVLLPLGTAQAADTTRPQVGSIQILTNSPTQKTSFPVRVTGVSDATGIRSVMLRVKLGKTVKSFPMKQRADQVWQVTFDARAFGYRAGTYQMDVKVTANSGRQSRAPKTSVVIKDAPAPAIGQLNLYQKSPTDSRFRMRAIGVSAAAGIKSVQFRVQNSRGKKFINAKRMSNAGIYDANFDISWFGGMTGTYTIDVKVTDRRGRVTYSPKQKVTLRNPNEPTLDKFTAQITSNPTEQTSFTVTASGLRSTVGFAKVSFRVYDKYRGTSSAKYFPAKRTGADQYQGKFDLAMMGGQSGRYIFSVAATDKRGQTVHFPQTLTVQVDKPVVPIGSYAIMGNAEATVAQMKRFFIANARSYRGPVSSYITATGGFDSEGFPVYYTQRSTPGEAANYDDVINNPRLDLERLIRVYMEEGAAEGVKPEVAFAQMCLETGFLRFGGDVIPPQCNFAGIGTTGGGVQGAYFSSVRMGVRAQIQHLKAYASTAPLNLPLIDPRFHLVTRGCAPTVEGLAGKWAVPGLTYTATMLNYLAQIKS